VFWGKGDLTLLGVLFVFFFLNKSIEISANSSVPSVSITWLGVLDVGELLGGFLLLKIPPPCINHWVD